MPISSWRDRRCGRTCAGFGLLRRTVRPRFPSWERAPPQRAYHLMMDAAEILVEWRDARAAAQRHLKAFESGQSKLLWNGVDVSHERIDVLRSIVALYTALIESGAGFE
jgi:hypothetical protein